MKVHTDWKWCSPDADKLKRKKNTWMAFTILLLTASIFLLVLNSRLEVKIGKLEKRIHVLESAFAEKESMVLMPDGKGGVKEFEIIRRF